MEKIAAQSNQTKDVLSYLQMIQKLCNHPTILTMSDTMSKERTGMTKEELSLLGVPVYAGSNGANVTDIMPAISGKMDVLHRLMRAMRQEKDPKNRERIVVISIFTQTLDLVEKMCAKEKWPVMRLDGKIAVKKRQAMVNEVRIQIGFEHRLFGHLELAKFYISSLLQLTADPNCRPDIID